MLRSLQLTAAGAALALSVVLGAQSPGMPADILRVVQDAGGFTADDIAALQAGRVAVKTTVSADNLEAFVVAAVRIGSTGPRTLDYFHQLTSYVDGQTTLAYGFFEQPPAEANLSRLSLDPDDLTDLANCGDDSCEVRMPGRMPEEARGALDWRASDAAPRANAWMRRELAAYAAAYLSNGDRALKGYNDRAMPLNMPSLWQGLLERSRVLDLVAPRLRDYLAAFPTAKPADVDERVAWDKQRYTGLKPVIGATHVLTWKDAANPNRAVVVQKQIFASRYFFGSLAVTLVQQDPAASAPTTYVMYANRTRGDLLKPPTSATGLRARITNLGATVQRRIGEQLVHQSAERLMGAMKEALER